MKRDPKKTKMLRRTVDVLMTALLPCLMAYSLIGETFHEIAGVAMLALFAVAGYGAGKLLKTKRR